MEGDGGALPGVTVPGDLCGHFTASHSWLVLYRSWPGGVAWLGSEKETSKDIAPASQMKKWAEVGRDLPTVRKQLVFCSLVCCYNRILEIGFTCTERRFVQTQGPASCESRTMEQQTLVSASCCFRSWQTAGLWVVVMPCACCSWNARTLRHGSILHGSAPQPQHLPAALQHTQSQSEQELGFQSWSSTCGMHYGGTPSTGEPLDAPWWNPVSPWLPCGGLPPSAGCFWCPPMHLLHPSLTSWVQGTWHRQSPSAAAQRNPACLCLS